MNSLLGLILNTLILSLGFGQLLRFEVIGLPIYLHDLLAFITLLLTFNSRRFSLSASLKLFFVGLLFGWIVAIFQYPFISLAIPFLYTLRLILYILIFESLRVSKIKFSKEIFIWSGFIALIIGYLQYLILPDMRWAQFLGWDDHLNRLTLPHFDPAYTGAVLSLTVLLLYQLRYGWLARTFLPAILLTYSRSVWLTLTIVGCIYAFEYRLYRQLLIAVCMFVLVIWVLPVRFGEGTNLLRTFSISSRWDHDQKIVRDLSWRLLTGNGFNTFYARDTNLIIPNHANSPNNSYLFILATVGIIGLIGWGRFMIDLYKLTDFKYVLIFYYISSIFNNVMFYPHIMLWIILLTVGVNDSVKVPNES